MGSRKWTDLPDWFARTQVADGVHHIVEPYYRDDYRCNMYLIQGESRDLVIDTGLGLASLRAFVGGLSPDPTLVSSHGHYDHIGSNFEFTERWIHAAEAEFVAHPTRANTYADLLLATEDFRRLPWEGFDAADWTPAPAPATALIAEGDVVDLGGRRFTVLHTPGHSWGGVCLWDEDTSAIFCADTVYEGELFDHLSCSDIPTYVQTMRRLGDLPVKIAYPGHGPILSGDRFREIARGYVAAHE